MSSPAAKDWRNEEGMPPNNDLIVHPGTGEVLDDLGAYDADTLAEAVVLLREKQTDLRRMQQAVEAELRERLTEKGLPRGRVWVTGSFELKFRNASVWDGDELEGVLRALHDDGVLSSQDVLDLVEHQIKVRGSNVDRLLKRLTGEPHAAIESCRRWEQKGMSVDRSRPLLPE